MINEGLGKTPKLESPKYKVFMRELMQRRRNKAQPRKCRRCGQVHVCIRKAKS